MKKSCWLATMVFVMIAWAGASLAADRGPNYDCGNRMQQCVAGCDDSAGTSHNSRKYQQCLDSCDEFNKSCTGRQGVADDCATAFKACTKGAQGETDREGCRWTYRRCKGG